jgi:hypothetical protein
VPKRDHLFAICLMEIRMLPILIGCSLLGLIVAQQALEDEKNRRGKAGAGKFGTMILLHMGESATTAFANCVR